MLLYIASAVALLFLILIIFIATRPAAFSVQRSTTINAPTETIFPLLNDFHQWHRWSPFEKFDPNMKITHDGPQSGPNSVRNWSGNKKAGAGRITILSTTPPTLLTMKLEMFKPFPANNQIQFTLTPTPKGTTVCWIMNGKNNFPAKAFCLVMNMDKMIGKDFEEGLNNLNTIAQSELSKSP